MDTTAVYALILAGGNGVRFGKQDKLWQLIDGKPVWLWSVETFLAHPQTAWVGVVVSPARQPDYALVLQNRALAKPVEILPVSGANRRESAFHGLQHVPSMARWIAVHDAARPFFSSALMDRLIETAYARGSAIPTLPMTDTLKQVGEENQITGTLPRESLHITQTPQLFRADWLREAHAAAAREQRNATDDAGLLEQMGLPVYRVDGEQDNLKITHMEDLHFARWQRDSEVPNATGQPVNALVRVGIGYDIHQLAAGRRLVLGGVEIPHTMGLLGHSDADVVLHAICDALLGAASLGDIGQHFPNTDNQWKDIDSLILLQHVVDLLENHGWRIAHIDGMILAQSPKLAPHLVEMKARIAQTARINLEQISLKATTTEGLGALGREEGIACQAVATIERTRA